MGTIMSRGYLYEIADRNRRRDSTQLERREESVHELRRMGRMRRDCVDSTEMRIAESTQRREMHFKKEGDSSPYREKSAGVRREGSGSLHLVRGASILPMKETRKRNENTPTVK